VDLFSVNFTSADFLALYVTTDSSRLPVRMVTASTTDQVTTIIDLYGWTPTQPPPQDFVVPSYCTSASANADADAEANTAADVKSSGFRRLTQAVSRHIAKCSGAATN